MSDSTFDLGEVIETLDGLGVDGVVQSVTAHTDSVNILGALSSLALSFGSWNYYAGVSGTVQIAAGQRVLAITICSVTASSFTINGGVSVTLPAGICFSVNPGGNLVAPMVVFTGTASYFIEVVS